MFINRLFDSNFYHFRDINFTGASSGTTNTATNTTSADQQGATVNTTDSTNPTAPATGNPMNISNAYNIFQNLVQLMNMLNGLGGADGSRPRMGGAVPGQPQLPPKERFESQLQQLESMGYTTRERNILALVQKTGSVEAAIQILIYEP